MALLDADGKTLAEADDTALFVQDPFVSYITQRAGTCYVQVRHSMYNAANEVYLLHVGLFARPTVLYPAGGPVGSDSRCKCSAGCCCSPSSTSQPGLLLDGDVLAARAAGGGRRSLGRRHAAARRAAIRRSRRRTGFVPFLSRRCRRAAKRLLFGVSSCDYPLCLGPRRVIGQPRQRPEALASRGRLFCLMLP